MLKIALSYNVAVRLLLLLSAAHNSLSSYRRIKSVVFVPVCVVRRRYYVVDSNCHRENRDCLSYS
jgi:hypothetical protein